MPETQLLIKPEACLTRDGETSKETNLKKK